MAGSRSGEQTSRSQGRDRQQTSRSQGRGGRPQTAPTPQRRDERRSDRGSQASVVSGGSRGSRTSRSSAPRSEPRGDGGGRQRARSQDGSSYRGPHGNSTARESRSGRYGGTGDGSKVPIHATPKDISQFAMNSPDLQGGRMPNGRLLAGTSPDQMVYHPRAGQSRTQFGGVWEDHKNEDRPWPPQSGTKSGMSDFGDDAPTDPSTYQYHYGLSFNGDDSMGHVKPNMFGTATSLRGVNGYGRNVNGGYFMREQFGELKRYAHADAWRAMPAWGRSVPEPTRPGPGYTRTDMGGYFRT